MSANDTRRGQARIVLRRIGLGLVVAGLGVAIVLPAAAQAAEPLASHRSTLAEIPASLAGRTPSAQTAEVDLFRTFTDCLANAADQDSMYPGVDPSEVNRCLEDHGVL